MNPETVLCSVVTRSVLPEFRLLKYSFELYHGQGHRWVLRTDRFSAVALEDERDIACIVFTEEVAERPDIEGRGFRTIVRQKMNAFADAWDSAPCDSVLFLDADLVITGRVLDVLEAIGGQVLLTPNYYPKEHEFYVPIHGYYNAGLALSRTRGFHGWWQDAFLSQPDRWTDQAVLNDAPKRFEVGSIPGSVNVGFWRSPNGLQHPRIPDDCSCLHVHFFQPLRSVRQWIDRAFALHCVEYLRASPDSGHAKLAGQILAMDPAGWYRATLAIR